MKAKNTVVWIIISLSGFLWWLGSKQVGEMIVIQFIVAAVLVPYLD